MDEDFMLWEFLEQERERVASSDDRANADGEVFEEEDDFDDEYDDEFMDQIAEKLGLGILRQGGNN